MNQEQAHLDTTIKAIRGHWMHGSLPPREIESIIEQVTGAAKAVAQVAYKEGFSAGTRHLGCADCE